MKADSVVAIAQKIANCDFRVTVTNYVTHSSPWYITVGESNWSRELRVMAIEDDNSDALLDIIANNNESFGERRITLKDLIANRYLGIKQQLQPKSQAA